MKKDPRWCRECRNAYHNAWHWKNREKCVKRMQELRQEHPARYRDYAHAYNQRHPERRKEQFARSRAKRIDKIREYDYTKYWSNPDKARRYVRDWRLKNHEKVLRRERELHHMNKTKRNAECRRWKRSRFFYERARKWEKRHAHAISPLTLWGLWKRQRGQCSLTGRRLNGRVHHGAALDHIVARANGGTGDASNLRWLCFEANVAKGTLTDAQLLTLCRDIDAHASEQRCKEVGFDPMQHLAGVMA